MKSKSKLFGIIAIAALVMFSFAACEDSPGGTVASFTVTYNGNTHTSGTVPTDSNSPYQSGATVTVRNHGNLAKTGYTFSGWNTAANGSGGSYSAGSTFAIYADTVLYAQWTPSAVVTHSIDGIWVGGSGMNVTVNTSTGILTHLGSPGALTTDALDKNYLKLGDQLWRNITSTGDLTWSGQTLSIRYYTSSPNVAIGTVWNNSTFTMSSDGQTLQIYTPGNETPNATYTRGSTNYSINGIWGAESGWRITASGSTGILTNLGSPGPLTTSAIDKGYITLGDQLWRNVTSTGNLTWSGQTLSIRYYTNSPNVAIGTVWSDSTFTMSGNGQSLQIYTPGNKNPSSTYSRQ